MNGCRNVALAFSSANHKENSCKRKGEVCTASSKDLPKVGLHQLTATSEIGSKFRLELRHSGYVNIVKSDSHLVSITIRGPCHV